MERNKLLSKPAAYGIFGLIGVLFLFCCLTGRDLAKQGNLLWTAGYALRVLGVSLVGGGALGGLVCFLCRLAASAMERPKRGEAGEGGASAAGRLWIWLRGRAAGDAARPGRGRGRVFGISLCLVLLAWLPAFLAYYPAICAYDAPIQLGQVLSDSYIDHHPIAHTLLIKWALWAGRSLFGEAGGANAGIGMYAVLQMAFLASAFAYGISWLWRRGISRMGLAVVQLFCMLYPFHLYMSVSVTKDTVFASFFLFQLLSLAEIVDTHRRRDFVVFFLAGVGMVLFRNNGKFAFLALLAALVAALVLGKRRRLWDRLLLWSILAFLAGNAALMGIYKAVGAQHGDKREMLSLPIQQLARTMVYHGGAGVLSEDDNTMEEGDKALIDDFILNQAYRRYRPDFADPVKSNTNTYVARYRTGEFLSTYLGLFLRYPGDYLNAALAVDAGYLYPGDVSHAYVNAQEGQAAGGGYVQTRWDELVLNEAGISKDSKWPWLFGRMEAWADGNAYLRLPVLKYLFVPGVWIWLYLLLAGWRLLRREFGGCIPLSLVFGYFLTLLLGPTVQLRYIYPIMIAFPFLLASAFCTGGRDKVNTR